MNSFETVKRYKNLSESPVSLLDRTYEMIENDDLNDYITLTKNIAYEEAYKSEKRYKEGNPLSELDGVLFSIKDNIAVENIRMTCGSKILSDFISPYNATAVERIMKKGGIIVGKTNMDEFAMGSSNETSYFGPVKNPKNKDYVPGGSSGGSAASVASGHACISIGSDTGGSIRQPASFCGCVGFKPTYGTISRYGLTAFSSSLDTVGIASNCVADSKLAFEAVRGRDEHDSTIEDKKNDKRNYKKIGYISVIKHMDGPVREVYEKRISQLSDAFVLEEVAMDFIDVSISTYQIQTMCESSSNLARFDGIKYGLQPKEGKTLRKIYSAVRGEGFGSEVKRRILIGTYFLTERDGEYYELSFKLRDYIANQIDLLFTKVDAIVLPTSLTLPFRFDEKTTSPLQMHLSDSLTAFANLSNVPAISLNGGYIDNLPCGIQLVAKRNDDDNLLEFASTAEEIWSKNE
ncbi:MAG: Asp-tRNA(Asn)/Glu-tRNA(Gln) amidotransferase subunit GatA [bacterium]|nr:Asp-tRNA(Asn)/Glu-tRNA(Gln) amidotransferase subunit GatA [bacterium]